MWNGKTYNVGDVLDPMDNYNYYRLVGMTPSPVDSPSRDPLRSRVSSMIGRIAKLIFRRPMIRW